MPINGANRMTLPPFHLAGFARLDACASVFAGHGNTSSEKVLTGGPSKASNAGIEAELRRADWFREYRP